MKFIILCFIFLFFSASSASAISFGSMPSTGDYGTDAPTVSDARTVVGYVQTVVKWAYTIFFIIAVLFVLFSAYGYLTGAGNPEAVSKAHKQLMYAAVAVIVALLAVSFNTIVKNLMTGGGGGGGGSGGGSGGGGYGGGQDSSEEALLRTSYGCDDISYGDNSCVYEDAEGNLREFTDGYFYNTDVAL